MNARQWKPIVTGLAGLAAGVVLAAAPEPTLNVGDPAPPLQTGKWIQGNPVKEFTKGKAYLVEFWATWCGPCRVSIPHLNEIHNRYQNKGLIVIGQDCWEQDEDAVAPFVKKMGSKMTYRVALDDKEGGGRGKMAETWMAAAGRNGIPSAFLVDTAGRIAWIGHPMQLKDAVIEAVLNGTFDSKKAAAEYRQRQQNEAELRLVWRDLNRAVQNKDWDGTEVQLAKAEKLLPEDERDQLDVTRFGILIAKKDYPAAYKLAGRISDAYPNNTMLQNELAWRIATDPAIEQRDLELAEKIANRANDAAKGNDASVLDTLARVLFMRDKKEQAIALQEKAVKLTEGPQQKSLQNVLDRYRKGQLPQPE